MDQTFQEEGTVNPNIFFKHMLMTREERDLTDVERPAFTSFVLPEAQILTLLDNMICVFKNEPNLLRVEAPVMICGDIHGQYHDLIRVFEMNGYPPLTKYLFLGDYVDRGKYSLETICLLFVLKLKFPEHVYLLRGNHEDESLNRAYGFYDECKRKYNVKVFKLFTEVFKWLPISACVSDKILCMHGGISPDLHYIEDINSISRNIPIPDDGLLCDLLWSDPDKNVTGFAVNDDRGVGYTFGKDAVKALVERNGLDLICRAHQVVEDGYEFFANKKLVTIFSAPNYDNSFDNSAAMLWVNENLVCDIRALVPAIKKFRRSK